MRKLQLALLVVGVGALAWMIYRLGPSTLLAGMLAVGWGFVLTCSAHLGGLLLDSVVLRACAGVPGREVPYREYARISIAGHGINAVTPLGKVGEVVKYTLLDERLKAADAAGALVAQNIASFVVNCGLIALASPVAFLFLDADGLVAILFGVVGVGFLGAGAVGLVILRHGIGSWPFAVLRRVRIGRIRCPKARIEKWQRSWAKVEKSWKEATEVRGAMPTIWVGSILSRLCNVTEGALLLHFLGGTHVVAAAFLSLASYQFTGWVFTFVPMQAGTAEAAAYMVFRAAGLSPQLGVFVEIGRRLRGVVFIALGLALLGRETIRRFLSSDQRARAA